MILIMTFIVPVDHLVIVSNNSRLFNNSWLSYFLNIFFLLGLGSKIHILTILLQISLINIIIDRFPIGCLIDQITHQLLEQISINIIVAIE